MKAKDKRKRRSLKQDERAVSPVIGVIMMIAITVVISAVVASFAYGIIGGVKRAPDSSLVVEDANVGNKNITVIHYGGDTIVDAFTSGPDWDSMEVRVNGETHDINNNTALNGTWSDSGWGTTYFKPGDELELNVSAGVLHRALESGDSITILYTPTGDVFQRVKVT